jgi:Tol biopolymer transport system component
MTKHHSIRNLLGIMTALVCLTACGGGAGTQVPASTATAPDNAAPQDQPTFQVPPELNLSGKLLLSDYALGITEFDFSTKQVVQVFRPPENGFVGAAVLSPDGRTFFMVYSRPRDIGDPLYGASDIYTLSADGSGEPNPVLKATESGYYYFSPWWSPDGQSVYYGRLYSPLGDTPPTKLPGYYLTRFALANGPPQDLLTNVLVVRISADGKKMFYVSINPDTTMSSIYAADPDGTHPVNLLSEGERWIIDSLALSPDEKTLVFSSANNDSSQSGLSLLDQLMGVRVAEAHNLPSDLWIMKVGETPRQLTHLSATGFIEDFSPDGQYIAFACSSGIYIIRPDGSGETKISSDLVFGNLQWVL